jgi:hypothetical protein
MSTQPEALRLANALEKYWGAESGHDRERQAAAELRRLHAVNESDTALLRQALYALENSAVKHPQQIDSRNAAIAALRERLGDQQ